MCINAEIASTSGLKTALTVMFSHHDFLLWTKMLAIWQTVERVLGISQVDGRPPVLMATSQSNGNGQTLTTHRIQTP